MAISLLVVGQSAASISWKPSRDMGEGSLLPLSQGEAFTLASISYLAILVKYILAKKKSGEIETRSIPLLPFFRKKFISIG